MRVVVSVTITQDKHIVTHGPILITHMEELTINMIVATVHQMLSGNCSPLLLMSLI